MEPLGPGPGPGPWAAGWTRLLAASKSNLLKPSPPEVPAAGPAPTPLRIWSRQVGMDGGWTDVKGCSHVQPVKLVLT